MDFDKLLGQISACTVCHMHLPLGPRPVVQGHPSARILIISQAPGLKVHESGIPWNDLSGERLRSWLGVDRETFYRPELFAMLPMGFCYPGRGRSGDNPPRKECRSLWHSRFLQALTNVQLILLVGHYAQSYYLGDAMLETSTATIRSWAHTISPYLPLPHPSPRNNIWLARNPWFETELLPNLKDRVRQILEMDAPLGEDP
jgi:uracil-DNA glycosylase